MRTFWNNQAEAELPIHFRNWPVQSRKDSRLMHAVSYNLTECLESRTFLWWLSWRSADGCPAACWIWWSLFRNNILFFWSCLCFLFLSLCLAHLYNIGLMRRLLCSCLHLWQQSAWQESPGRPRRQTLQSRCIPLRQDGNLCATEWMWNRCSLRYIRYALL